MYKKYIDPLEVLKGLIITDIINRDDVIIFTCITGEIFRMHHEQDCCEDVYISDICGDLDDLLNSPILYAFEESGTIPDACESGTWTFYKIDTAKGGVTIRWNGYSNGYYSEAVSFELIED